MEDNIFGEIVSVYTRADAIADGMLIDISSESRYFKVPVAITCGLAGAIGFDSEHRSIAQVLLANLLFLIRRQNDNTNRIDFEFSGNKMYSLCHGGDNGEPVITIMLIHED